MLKHNCHLQDPLYQPEKVCLLSCVVTCGIYTPTWNDQPFRNALQSLRVVSQALNLSAEESARLSCGMIHNLAI